MMHPNEDALSESPRDTDAIESGDRRLAWTAPRMRRLTTSSAEFGAGDTTDAEGMS